MEYNIRTIDAVRDADALIAILESGAAIPLVVLYFAYDWIMEKLLGRFGVLRSMADALPPMMEVFRYILPVGLILGIGIGLTGSIITVRKHLDV